MPLLWLATLLRCIDSKSRPTYAEKIFLFIGSLMFFGVGELDKYFFPFRLLTKYFRFLPGGLVLASIDQIPEELIDNAIVLGCLSFFVAFVFLIDMSEKTGKRRTDATQTDTSSIDRHNKSQSTTTLNSQANLMESDGNRESMRSNGTQQREQQTVAIGQQSSNPFVNQQQTNDQSFPGQPQGNSYHTHYHPSHTNQNFPSMTFSEDVVETQVLPTAQQPVFSKVKQPATVLNHFETEPYKKILSRSNQQPAAQSPYSRYHDQAQHHHDPSFYDDFNDYRKTTYYQGPKVDQGKLVIRDYSQQPKPSCNCPNHGEEEQDSATIKSGYVSQVAKLWDDRMRNNRSSVRHQPKEVRGLNTVV